MTQFKPRNGVLNGFILLLWTGFGWLAGQDGPSFQTVIAILAPILWMWVGVAASNHYQYHDHPEPSLIKCLGREGAYLMGFTVAGPIAYIYIKKRGEPDE